MTHTELVEEINKLPHAEWESLKETIDDSRAKAEIKAPMTEEAFAKYLYAKGITGNIPDPSKWNDEDEDWEPIEVLGEPLSEMIIRERR